MKTTSLSTISTHLLVQSAKQILYFPVWWYTKGLANAGRFSVNGIHDFNATLGFTIWVKNIFTPMFGQHDFSGRLISFFMRFVNIIGRGIALLIVSIIYLLLFFVWILLPLFILYQLFFV